MTLNIFKNVTFFDRKKTHTQLSLQTAPNYDDETVFALETFTDNIFRLGCNAIHT